MDTQCNKVLESNLSLLAMLDMAQAYIDNSEVCDEISNIEYMLKGMRTILNESTAQLVK